MEHLLYRCAGVWKSERRVYLFQTEKKKKKKDRTRLHEAKWQHQYM